MFSCTHVSPSKIRKFCHVPFYIFIYFALILQPLSKFCHIKLILIVLELYMHTVWALSVELLAFNKVCTGFII